MRVLFFAPFKAITSQVPSGDREIARGLFSYLESRGEEVKVLSDFHSLFFWHFLRGILLYFPYFLLALLRAIKFRPAYFFTYHVYYKAPDPFAFLISWISRKPHFVFEGIYSEKGRANFVTWFGWFLTKNCIRRAQHVFTDKKADIDGLAKLLPREKITYIPPSIDLNFFQRNEPAREKIRQEFSSKLIVMGVAMLRPDRKSEGVEFLLQCLAELKAEGLDFFYLHVGDGEREEALKKLAAEGLSGNHRFLGRLNKNQVRDYLSAADIFAFPGIDEAFGMVYVEAQACGLPVVAFHNGGVPEAVADGRSGILCPLLQKSEMKSALRSLIQDSVLRKRMSIEARKFVEESFDREKNYSKMLEIIHKNL